MTTSNKERQSQKKKQNKSSRGKKRWLWLLILPVLFILGFGVYKVSSELLGFAHEIYEGNRSNKLRDADKVLKDKKPISILLTGIDNGALFYEDVEDGRTDVMMVITINPEDNSAQVTSIPRDALGPIGQTDDFDKLNHAYMDHDLNWTIDSLQRYLDIPIDYYVSVNMQGFIDVIDILGGIEVTPSLTFTQNGVDFKGGETKKLSGEEAIHYARMRKSDPEGDLGREKRQQEIVEAVIDKVASIESVPNYKEILNKLEDNIKTDFKVEDMFTLQQNYLDALQHLDKQTANNYQDLNLPFGYYLYIPESERIRLSNQIRASLGLGKTNSAIVYPAEYQTPEEYFPIVDNNGNLILDSDDLPVKPGVYKKDDLDSQLMKWEQKNGKNSSQSSSQVNETPSENEVNQQSGIQEIPQTEGPGFSNNEGNALIPPNMPYQQSSENQIINGY